MKKFIAIILLVCMTASLAFAEDEHLHIEPVNNEYRLLKGFISKMDKENDTFIVTSYGYVMYEWLFDAIEDWELGDIVIMLVSSNGTSAVTDDDVLSMMWTGTSIYD